MDLIAIDIGNSSVSVGVFAEGELKETTSFSISDLRDNLSNTLLNYREVCGSQPLGAKTVPIPVSSVNNRALDEVKGIVGDTFNQNAHVAGVDFSIEMPVGIEDTSTLGSDRLLTALAAFEVVGRADVVADFGTATTIDLINDSSIFLGGVIFPGQEMAAKSLEKQTSALPFIKPSLPLNDQPFGVNTEEAIRNGILYSTVGALREITERYATELGYWPQVIATGGFAKMISQKTELIENIVPSLCLNGIYLAYNKWRNHHESPEDLFSGDEL